MASLIFDKRMVYSKIMVAGYDMTKELGPYISSIKIKHTTMPKVTKSKSGSMPASPSTCVITISSKSYIEDIFIENMPIEVYLGYDFIYQPLAFNGRVVQLPDGSAREMLNYTVKCAADEIKLGYTEKSRVFRAQKADIIRQICAENGWQSDIRISDNNVIDPIYQPIATGNADLEILYRYAHEWSCVCWFEYIDPMTLKSKSKKVYFVDANIAHQVADDMSTPSQAEIMTQNVISKTIALGYRSSMTYCNVKQVDWKHKTGRAMENTDGGVNKWTEACEQASREGKVLYNGQTWELQPQYLKEAQTNPTAFFHYAGIVAREMTFRGEEALKTYFTRVPDNGLFPTRDPNYNGAGMEVVVHLNYGVPEWRPPRSAVLYHGSLNPMADGAHLPAWLSRYKFKDYIGLAVNEMELNYQHGELESVLHCSLTF